MLDDLRAADAVTWVPWAVIKDGGPWAVLILLAVAFLVARSRGIITSQQDVERTVGGYKTVIEHQEKELTYWRAASERKDLTIEKQADQIAKLTKSADLSAYALEAVLKEARRNDQLDP